MNESEPTVYGWYGATVADPDIDDAEVIALTVGQTTTITVPKPAGGGTQGGGTQDGGTQDGGTQGGDTQIGDTQTPTTTTTASVAKVRSAQTSFTLAKNGKLTIPYEVDMASGDASAAKLTWTSSKPGVATVQDGKVTAKKNGTVTITVTDETGKQVAKYTVKVVAKAVKVKKVTAKAKKSSLKAGQTTTISVKLTPKGATGAVAKFSLDSKSKKIVSVDKAGKVTAKKKGTATVTVKAGGKSAKVKITVK
ncbi:MAG: Ig-like domain-containing protein [Clostridiales Family XIII bacterium]|nr:Ig-like domain-containing protein [Clostridiales Family XIII bacterium]